MNDISIGKRPRPVVSCLRCRAKKLKCDRITPCENCTKAEIAEPCTYNPKGIAPLASNRGRSPPSNPHNRKSSTPVPSRGEPSLRAKSHNPKGITLVPSNGEPSLPPNFPISQAITSAPSNGKQPRPADSPDHASFGSLEDVKHRLAKVEELLGVARAPESSMTADVEQSTPTACLPLLGTVVAEGGRSRYHGQNDRITLLNQARE